MAKRISLKGKGADIFFGEYPPPPSSDAPAEELPIVDTAPPSLDDSQGSQVIKQDTKEPNDKSMKESVHARMQESLQDSVHQSKNASMREGDRQSNNEMVQASPSIDHTPPSPLNHEVLNSIWKDVSERATITNAFRYTAQELIQLTDILYEITKRHGIKMSKQDIARLGLNAVLWDYQARGDSSLLGEFVIRRKRRGQGE